ncbi:MAG: DcaP family trimeric outer membrane transporter [Chitinophagaceae bacterium]
MRFIAQWCLLSILLVMIVMPVQAQQGKGLTRSDIENNRYAGFLFTDIKGVRLQFNGFVQGDFMFDFNDIANKTGFQPSTITVPQLKEANTAFSIRQSRFAFTALGEPDSKGRHLEAHLEFDFASPNNTTGLRLRHAYMKHGKWLFGHTWTNFMDASIWPNIMDAWGPNGYVLLRQVQMRFTQKINERQSVSFSLEQTRFGCENA